MKQSIEDIVARCLEDANFARDVLAGDEHPQVRAAIIADLEDARGVGARLNPQPLPPGETGYVTLQAVEQERIWKRWASLDRTNLKSLLTR